MISILIFTFQYVSILCCLTVAGVVVACVAFGYQDQLRNEAKERTEAIFAHADIHRTFIDKMQQKVSKSDTFLKLGATKDRERRRCCIEGFFPCYVS